jgi:hypothetical protein
MLGAIVLGIIGRQGGSGSLMQGISGPAPTVTVPAAPAAPAAGAPKASPTPSAAQPEKQPDKK